MSWERHPGAVTSQLDALNSPDPPFLDPWAAAGDEPRANPVCYSHPTALRYPQPTLVPKHKELRAPNPPISPLFYFLFFNKYPPRLLPNRAGLRVRGLAGLCVRARAPCSCQLRVSVIQSDTQGTGEPQPRGQGGKSLTKPLKTT